MSEVVRRAKSKQTSRRVDLSDRVTIYEGDCLQVLPLLPDCSVDSVVTDPPYGISFMGKKWDYDVPSVDIWKECFRVLKPGGHLLSFAGTRTQHRMAVNIEDAGFEIRDLIAWVYGSGFPKSLDISKAIDKYKNEKRTHMRMLILNDNPGQVAYKAKTGVCAICGKQSWGYDHCKCPRDGGPVTEEALQWQGWGTALKPAFEPITVARKPFNTTVAANVLEYGTGGINVDGCRVGHLSEADRASATPQGKATAKSGALAGKVQHEGERAEFDRPDTSKGRWPANIITDGSEEVVGMFPVAPSRGFYTDSQNKVGTPKQLFGSQIGSNDRNNTYAGEVGSAARFFYCAKASKQDRDEGCEGMDERKVSTMNSYTSPSEGRTADKNGGPKRNHHPTVKPTALMRYLCRLITPPQGTVLDMFMGSGSTGKAAVLEGFGFVGIDLSGEYVEIARARIEHAMAQANESTTQQKLDL